MGKYKYNKSSSKRFSKDVLHERAKIMYEYKTKQGFSLERIGNIFGLTRERARQIISDFERQQLQQSLKFNNDGKGNKK
jgi:DNA-directed RNA polymerase sigma subunit (sigma70/sigma32)